VFTVVLTEQAHLDSIEEYKAFLKPFLDSTNIAFCRWRPNGKNLEEAVPALYDTVSRHERWRLIVVCEEDGMAQKNPFDTVGYVDPPIPEKMEVADYLAARREARLAAYEKAAKQNLTRLMTWLCQPPLVSSGRNNAQDYDPEFAEFLAQAQAKESLRAQILGDQVIQIALPSEVICVARRCCMQEDYDIRTSWDTHQEISYSRFYDYNLYFDKMRYLIFDTLPKDHRNYTFDYIRFLYALMLLAQNETPMAALNPNRVYTLLCQNDEAALRRLLESYDDKLTATLEVLHGKMHKLQNQTKERLHDRDAKAIFCSNVTIPVSTVKEFDQSTLYVPREGLGLAGDCPKKEAHVWEDGYNKSRRALVRFMKAPRRALRKTAVEMHRMDTPDLDKADRLNNYQLEDVAEYVAEEELKMVATHTCDLYDVQRYTKAQEAQDQKVRDVIERRMTRKWTIALGITALVCCLIGFLPMLFTNITAGNGTLFSLLFIGVGLGIIALTAFISLYFLRHPLRKAYSDYNGIMKGVINDVETSMVDYSLYMSHACNVMRGNAVLNYCREREDPDNAKLRILKKHEIDVMSVREEMGVIFGVFLPRESREVDPELAYPYDFTRAVDFTYPIPFSAEQQSTLEFLQTGNMVNVPVDFVKTLRVRREELYD